MSITNETWITPDGKKIEYTKERYEVVIDEQEMSRFFLEINTFAKNTKVNIVQESDFGFCAGDGDAPDGQTNVYKWKTFPNNEFPNVKDSVIREGIALIKKKWSPEGTEDYA